MRIGFTGLGNLTLSAYNPELWNHPFAKKREEYSKSNIVITRELAAYEGWTDVEIRERGRRLAAEAGQTWIGPKEQVSRAEAETDDDDEGPGRRELRLRFWSGLNDFLASEHPDMARFEPRPSWTVRLPSGVRHIGLDLRFSLRHDYAGVDVWFWREASLPLWERIRQAPEAYDELLGAKLAFGQIEGRSRARMFVTLHMEDPRNPSSWPPVYAWLGERLSLLQERVLPRLRLEMDRSEAAS